MCFLYFRAPIFFVFLNVWFCISKSNIFLKISILSSIWGHQKCQWINCIWSDKLNIFTTRNTLLLLPLKKTIIYLIIYISKCSVSFFTQVTKDSLIFAPDEILGFKEKDKHMSSASIKEIGFAPIIICYWENMVQWSLNEGSDFQARNRRLLIGLVTTLSFLDLWRHCCCSLPVTSPNTFLTKCSTSLSLSLPLFSIPSPQIYLLLVLNGSFDHSVCLYFTTCCFHEWAPELENTPQEWGLT